MKETKIQWADSTGNIQMGCEGCELVKGRVKPVCYAKVLTDRYAGSKGWPDAFEKPKLFLERLPKILSWPDLTGVERPGKPWLNGLPRVIFLNDMGDTFSKGMPKDWFAPVMEQLSRSKHIYMVLTKWPQRMAEFSARFPFPANVWPGTTVTSEKTKFRALQLMNVKTAPGCIKWLSVEPLWGPINWRYDLLSNIKLFIYGGESGNQAAPFNIQWLESSINSADYYNRYVFIKQLGSNAFYEGKKLNLNDYHGGDPAEWPDGYNVREFPKFTMPVIL